MLQQLLWKLSISSEPKLHCKVHPEYELSFLHFGEKSERKSRMLCDQCMTESVNQNENKCQFVSLQNFINDPKNTIQKITKMDKDDGQHNMSTILDKIDKDMLKFEEEVKMKLVNIKENIKYMRKLVYDIGEELSSGLMLNDVVKQIQLLNQSDIFEGTNELIKLEDRLNLISDIKIKIYNKYNGKHRVTANTLIDNLQKIKNDIDSTSKKCMLNLEKLNLYVIEDIKDFPLIHHQISEGIKIEYQLLYSSARDGLNCQAYWAKCNMQQNLLTIMTSKNGSKFGGYSPCQINQQLHNYIQDPTMKSFMIQYNKKEIYKLKNKEHAICCRSDYGPTFGSGHDLYVAGDFQSGYSHGLGTTYDISGYNIADKTTHIFGDKKPQVQECKVYKVVFI